MALTEPGYRPRLIDDLVAETLAAFGALSIEGPKYCGKTWTALNHAQSAFFVMDPDGGYANLQLARLDPGAALRGAEPRLLDEWQKAVGLWDAVRFEVDRGKSLSNGQAKAKGRFILTGSATPAKERPLHSGAGRIATIQMRPMTLFESGLSTGELSLGGLLKSADTSAIRSTVDLNSVAQACVCGGWPENIDSQERFADRMPQHYLESIRTNDISSSDDVPRAPNKVGALLLALARNNATMVSNVSLKWDVSKADGSISAPTLSSYLKALKAVFVLEELDAWAPEVRTRSRVRTAPKRYLVDPSLVCAALGMSASRLLNDLPTFGTVFEGLCMRDLQVYALANDAKLLHYHDHDGLEVDFIIQARDGSYAAVEVKLNPEHVDSAAASLNRFAAKMAGKGAALPKLRLAITGTGNAHRRQDGIIVAPITTLRN